jgi:hypothetical protein
MADKVNLTRKLKAVQPGGDRSVSLVQFTKTADDERQRLREIQQEIGRWGKARADARAARRKKADPTEEPDDPKPKAGYAIPELLDDAVHELARVERGQSLVLNTVLLWVILQGLALLRDLDHTSTISRVATLRRQLPAPNPDLALDPWSYKPKLGDVTEITIRGLSADDYANIASLRRGWGLPHRGGASVVVSAAILVAFDHFAIPLKGGLGEPLNRAADVLAAKLAERASDAERVLVVIEAVISEADAAERIKTPTLARPRRRWHKTITVEEG